MKEIINEKYENIAKIISISEAVHEEVKKSYVALGEYISNHSGVEVNIYPQGSMALGTTIKPISEEDDYDLDIVCEIKNDFESAEELKKFLGDILKESERYSSMLDEEGRRCWTLKYSSKKFHLDILPAILKNQSSTKLLITDKQEDGEYEFKDSDPKAYIDWFKTKEKLFKPKTTTRDDNVKSEVEELNDNSTDSTLQLAVRLLKYHRDLKYKDTDEIKRKEKPISIIITTILGQLYTGTEDVYELVTKFTSNYTDYISVDVDGSYVISNPVNNSENFADKWKIYPERKEAFFNWTKEVKRDFVDNCFINIEGTEEQAKYLSSILGENVIKELYAYEAKNFKQLSKKYIDTSTSTAKISKEPTKVEIKGHTYYGKQNV